MLAVTTVLVVAGGLLIDRRPLPGLAFLLVTIPLGGALSVGVLPFTQFVVVAFGLYRIAVVATRRVALIALVGAVAVQVVCLLYAALLSFFVPALLSVIAWLLGRAVRQAA